jgi:hypothetical protein
LNGVKVLAARLDGVDAKTLREAVDRCKDQLKAAAVVLATVEDGKVRLGGRRDSGGNPRIKAGELVNVVAQQVGGKGGGRPDLAQAGGADPTQTGCGPARRPGVGAHPTDSKGVGDDSPSLTPTLLAFAQEDCRNAT